MSHYRTLRPLATALLLAAGLVAGCKGMGSLTHVKALLDDPARFDHQIVRIAGHVTHALGIMGYGAYQVDDGTGSITVVTQENGAPREGAKVGVEGEFRSAFTLGSQTVAVILEKQRYDR